MKLGLISDTHGLLRESAVRALGGSELIVHAGDVGAGRILEPLRSIAPVLVVRGNIDTLPLPETAEADFGGARIYVIHNIQDLAFDPAARGYQIVVSGHSHKPSSRWEDGVLYLNLGAAGPRRFRLPITVATLDIANKPWEMHLIDVGI